MTTLNLNLKRQEYNGIKIEREPYSLRLTCNLGVGTETIGIVGMKLINSLIDECNSLKQE